MVDAAEATIHELHLPASLDGAEAAEFREYCEVLDRILLEHWGHLDLAASLPARLTSWADNDYRRLRNFYLRADGRIVGRGFVELSLKDNLSSAWLRVDIAAPYRRRGLGGKLLRHLESVAREEGRSVLMASSGDPDRPENGPEVLASPVGTGAVPRNAPGTAFALRHGYSLAQATRYSTLVLDGAPDWAALMAEAEAASTDYELLAWTDSCPEELVDEFAVLMGRMSTDAPVGGLEYEAEAWDRARVRTLEQETADEGQTCLVVAARHRASGELGGYTALYVDPLKPWLGEQDDTLVAAGHRGHRLGMRLKIANLRRLKLEYPRVERVTTMNAEENRYMLAINVALGFAPTGAYGEWQKRTG
ncbi:GNAT family N-acetyltransferase [Arthrobacter cupressi]|uniref:Acetyltransferase (GNAT) family protein n=1 Tax=Arthrobacter cupressi TaxID=1045773 RepID=A0A1G8MZU2_9MICC|nr:GNAT family N-acetyltransferase [Arthrobacter cupressi]NYD76993.1 GNAT superfamily N-acetyltransferase [Arthrobacter cupressi]SDI73385.1 Acetyltransferase (GNAT) family protein [Arthrobacter cupressi]